MNLKSISRIMTHRDYPSLRDVQRDILSQAKAAAEEVGGRLFFADILLTPRPVVWFCGTPAQSDAFVEVLGSGTVRIARQAKSKLQTLDFSAGIPMTAVAYIHYAHEGNTIHGSTSGIVFDFCVWSENTKSWRATTARIESEADSDYLDTLNDFSYLGVNLPILKNCHAVWQTHPARDKVDIVYTWVNGNDPAWLARKATFQPDVKVIGANSAARFESGSELYYSIISALRYFGDLGRIYVVTDNQIPDLPPDILSQVTIVDHTEIFDDLSCLPTFNSHAIEAHLHRISGLRQHFLYVNDDVIFGRPTAACTFYDELGRSFQFYSNAVSTPHTKIGDVEAASDAAARNNRKLLQERFGFFAFRKLKHTPLVLDRKVMRQMRRDLPEAWTATVGNRFRSPSDYSIAGHLYAHYAAYTGHSVVGTIRYNYYDIGAEDFKGRFGELLKRHDMGFDTFCVNDTLTTPMTRKNRVFMDSVLRRVYPQKGIVKASEAGGQKRPVAKSSLRLTVMGRARRLARKVLPYRVRKGILEFFPSFKND